MATTANVWTAEHVKSLAPDEKSIPAAREVLRKGGFGTVEPTADGRGWWVVCRGITDTYQVSARQEGSKFACECTCPSWKRPCKHALALLLYLVDHPELRVEAEAPKVAASDFEGLIRAVFREPEDDTPRLIFADYLEENGQSERAALIRYQCEQARLRPNAKRYKELAKLIAPLEAKFRKEFEPVPEGLEYEFRRGFLRMRYSLATLNADALPARFAGLFRDGWVESLGPIYYGDPGTGEGFAPLAAQVGELDLSRRFGWLINDQLLALVANTAEARRSGRLARITVSKRNQKGLDRFLRAEQGESVQPVGPLPSTRQHVGLTPAVFDLMLRSGQLDGARGLSLGGALGDAELTALSSADLGELRWLRLEEWVLTRTGVETLANSTALKQLVTLDLYSCDLGDGVETLAASSGLRNLQELRLGACGLTDADAEALAKSRNLPSLAHIDLRLNATLTARGAAAVLASENFPRLGGVNLYDAGVAPREQIPLVLDAPDRADLVLGFTQIQVRRRIRPHEFTVEVVAQPGTRSEPSGELFDALKGCAGAKRVTQFSAPGLRPSAKDIAALAAGLDPRTLWRLDLTDAMLRNDGAAALATAFADFELRELKLSKCRVQAAGVKALVGSPLWKRLEVLDLSDNNLGKAGVAALVEADDPPKLKELIVTEFCLGVNDLNPRTRKTVATGAGKLKSKFGAALRLARD